VTRSSHRFRATLFLLVFLGGGLGVPLAHQLDHLLDKVPAEALEQVVATVPADGGLHDCSLCEVRIAAAEFHSEHAQLTASVAVMAAHAPEAAPLAATRHFDGRAPPALS
jgi:hypothetical protein